jgi:acetylglutamate kinase
MAAACAEYVRADQLVYLTDVAGVLDETNVVPSVSFAEMEELIRREKVTGGMVLKLEACKRALSAGVSQVHIASGATGQGLLASAQGKEFVGTRIVSGYPAAAGARR